MNDITEQRTMTEAFAPPADSELHKIPVLNDEEELIEMTGTSPSLPAPRERAPPRGRCRQRRSP